MEGKSRYLQSCTWVNYRLNTTEHNKDGIAKMRAYVDEQSKGGKDFVRHQVKKQLAILKQDSLFQ